MGGALGAVVGIASAPFTGGASLGLLAATGAVTGAITSVIVDGDPLRGALLGALSGPLSGGVGGAITSASTTSAFITQQERAKQQAKQAQAQMQAQIDFYNNFIAQTRAQRALDEQRISDNTMYLNQMIYSRNKIISADRKAVLKKAFFVDRYSIDGSEDNDLDPLKREPNNVRQQELLQEA